MGKISWILKLCKCKTTDLGEFLEMNGNILTRQFYIGTIRDLPGKNNRDQIDIFYIQHQAALQTTNTIIWLMYALKTHSEEYFHFTTLIIFLA